jgi:hypothetical protein
MEVAIYRSNPTFRRFEIAVHLVEMYLQPFSRGSDRTFTEEAVVRVVPPGQKGDSTWKEHMVAPMEAEEDGERNAIGVAGRAVTSVIEVLRSSGALNPVVKSSSRDTVDSANTLTSPGHPTGGHPTGPGPGPKRTPDLYNQKEESGDGKRNGGGGGDKKRGTRERAEAASAYERGASSMASSMSMSMGSFEPPVDLFDELDTIVFSFLAHNYFEGFQESEFNMKYHGFCCLAETSLTEDDFSLFRVLGRGGFGLVNGCKKCTSGKLFAMKVMDKRRVKLKKSENLCVNERNILAMVDSPFIVNLKYSFSTGTELFLILDLMTGGDLGFLLHRMGKLSIEHAR